MLPEGRTAVMGILNVTPDSFYDGGRHADLEAALAHARRLLTEGADLIDVGGESSRPGAASISTDEECGRVIPVVAALRRETDVPISIDTTKAAVAAEALTAGAAVVNDHENGCSITEPSTAVRLPSTVTMYFDPPCSAGSGWKT